jgi:hypothetical protein
MLHKKTQFLCDHKRVPAVSAVESSSSAFRIRSSASYNSGYMCVHRENGPSVFDSSLGNFVVLHLSLQTGYFPEQSKLCEISVIVAEGDVDRISEYWDSVWSKVLLPTPGICESQIKSFLEALSAVSNVREFETYEGFTRKFRECARCLKAIRTRPRERLVIVRLIPF